MGEPKPPAIRLYLTGPEGEEKNALLSDFTNALRAINGTLHNVERCLTGDAPAMQYEVADLFHSSAGGVIVPTRKSRKIPVADEVVEKHRKAIDDIENGRDLDPVFDVKAIRSFQSLAWPIREGGPTLAVSGVSITPAFKANVAKLLEPLVTSFGSVSGQLEAIDLHGDSEFAIYPPGSRQAVYCRFDDDEIPEVFEAVKRKPFVTVYGELAYQRGKMFPVSADVESIEIHPDADSLSDLLDAAGILVGLEGDAADLIRKSRDGWNRD